jgi:hypothetical protein
MKYTYFILCALFYVAVSEEEVPYTDTKYHKKLNNAYHAYEFDNLRLLLAGVDFSKIKTTHEQFNKPDKSKHCLTHPSMTMYELSNDRDAYIQYLKEQNGTQFYLGTENVDLGSKFLTFPFSYNDNNYYCGVLHDYCINSLMFMRCLCLV